MRIASPGLVLLAGFAVVVFAATAPAGLHGRPVPPWSWIVWSAVPLLSIAVLRSKKGGLMVAARQLAPIAPAVLLLTMPAVLFAAAEQGPAVGAALVARALATAVAGLATVSVLGPVDLVAGLRALKIPDRCVDVVHAMLVSLAAIVRLVEGMLRSRTARGAGRLPWSGLVLAPGETLRGFGRVTAALFLRSLERAEALERARRARGAGPW
jgi:energy-coupling factor transporter transmembrane protein EcfT